MFSTKSEGPHRGRAESSNWQRSQYYRGGRRCYFGHSYRSVDVPEYNCGAIHATEIRPAWAANDLRGYMRLLAASPILLLLAPLVTLAASPERGSTYRITLPRRSVAAGERLDLKLVPPPPRGATVAWSVRLTEFEGWQLPGGVYWAPYSIPPGTPPAKVSVRIRDGATVSFANVQIELEPGSVPGTEDCLGTNQTFSIAAAALTPPRLGIESGAYLIQRAEPVYPRSALVRGIKDTISVYAVVCRSGHVLDAHEALSYRYTGGNPFDPDPASLIEHDPRLVDAAVAAVRQYVFAPALVDGQPIAFDVLTSVMFDPATGQQVIGPDKGRSSASIAPNPLNPSGVLSFTTTKPGRASVNIYDVQGRLVRALMDEQLLPAGLHTAKIDGRDSAGRPLASGVYYYRVEAEGAEFRGRVVVLK